MPAEAVAFGESATKAFAALGGVEAARRAEDDPAERAEAAAALGALGIGDLDPRDGVDALAAAAALCEAAGRVALPYPTAGVLLRDGTGRPLAVASGADVAGRVRVDHGDLFAEWRAVSLSGASGIAKPAGERLATRLGPFVVDLTVDVAVGVEGVGSDDAIAEVARHLTLTAAEVLGTVDAAVDAAIEHVTGRIQFGKPLAAFQTVQFTLADLAVAVSGFRELVHFTIWRVAADAAAAIGDALAVRVHAIDVARTVLRSAQQLHGAAGVCDEYDVSVLTRHVQPALRLPWSAESTAAHLVAAVARDGFAGLFPHGATASK